MTTDILQSSLSPTQERGESRLSGGIIRETITDSEGNEFLTKIDYTLSGGVCVAIDYQILGDHSIPVSHLIELLQMIIERSEGRTLIFK